jgi:hypothetical protein
MDDAECSELCSCGAETLALSCHALCVPLVPCRTSLAYYSHAAPAYQAFRGRCLCYSGRFICMRPPPGEYKVENTSPSFDHERTKKFHFENFSFAVLIFNEIFLLFPPNHFIPVASQWNSIAPRWNFPFTRLQFNRRGIITSAHESRRTGCCASFAAIRRPAY